MQSEQDGFHLLLAEADSGRPILDSAFDSASAALAPLPAPRLVERPAHLGDQSRDPNVLPWQFWDYLYPDRWTSAAVNDALRPLLDLRQEQQGRAPQGFPLSAALSAHSVEQVCLDLQQRLFELWPEKSQRPRYLLLLGTPAELSFELQWVLQQRFFVGRLSFTRTDGTPDFRAFRAYAEKVVRFERAARTAPHVSCRLLQFCANDGSKATKRGYEELMVPLSQEPGLVAPSAPFYDPQQRLLHYDNQPSALWDWARTEHPGPPLLFTLSHGMGAPSRGWKSGAEQRALQGALVFSSCGGEVSLLTGEALEAPFLPGGFWFYFACFGAGTPRHSGYLHWMWHLYKEGLGLAPHPLLQQSLALEQPFISATAEAVLKNPMGPVGMVGHIDLAWAHSFKPEAIHTELERPLEKFSELLRRLACGSRLGVAFETLVDARSRLEGALAVLGQVEKQGLGEDPLLRLPPPGRRREQYRGTLWMSWQDLNGYILLGDPAARLCVSELEGLLRLRERASQAQALAEDDKVLGLWEGAILSWLQGKRAEAQSKLKLARLPGGSKLEGLAEVYREAGRVALRKALGEADSEGRS